MKYLSYVCIALFVISCETSGEVDFIMFNQTDKTVKVLGFDTALDVNTNGRAEPIIINPNSEFKVTRITGFDANVGFRFYSILGVDSVRVIFNNEKVLALTLESTYNQGQTIFQGNEEYQHFITEQDYNDAENCNGNCE